MSTIDFQAQSHKFPSLTGQAQTKTLDFVFDSDIVLDRDGLPRAEPAISSYTIGYTAFDDHNLGQVEIDLQIPKANVINNLVRVDVTFLLRDWSDNVDDPYEGSVTVLVIVERL